MVFGIFLTFITAATLMMKDGLVWQGILVTVAGLILIEVLD